jgi:hypothetical protein
MIESAATLSPAADPRAPGDYSRGCGRRDRQRGREAGTPSLRPNHRPSPVPAIATGGACSLVHKPRVAQIGRAALQPNRMNRFAARRYRCQMLLDFHVISNVLK